MLQLPTIKILTRIQILDLHGLHKKEAVLVLEEKIHFLRENRRGQYAPPSELSFFFVFRHLPLERKIT